MATTATTVFGLRYKYSSETGQSLMFYERDGNDLREDDLYEVQLKMIDSNRIPHTLPLSVEHVDLTATLHYDITSRSQISVYLKNHDSTMNDYYQLFLSIIKTLEQCNSYMLNQHNYILDKDFVFVGDSTKDVYLIYLPITNLRRNTTITEDIQKLLTDVAGDIQGLHGNEFKSILNYISDDSFSLSGLKQLLIELISVRSNVHQPDEAASEIGDLSPITEQNQTDSKNESSQATILKPSKQKEPTPEKDRISQIRPTRSKLPPLTNKEMTYLLGGGLILLALNWMIYSLFSNDIVLVLCIVITLYIIVGVIVYWKIWRPGIKKKFNNANVAKTTSQIAPQSAPNDYNKQNEPHVNDTAKQPIKTQHNEQISQPLAGTSFMSPNLGEHHDDTVLLGEEEDVEDPFSTHQLSPLLIKENLQGQEEPIMINSNPFIIGRNAQSVNYVETSVGVSRVHTEILKIDGTTYAIKDLGSKNGTKVNGNRLLPHKVYGLNEHDEIEIGRATFKFGWSNV